MRPWEIAVTAGATLSIVGIIFGRPRRLIFSVMAALTVLIASLQVWMEGSHWQLFPLYLSLMLILFGYLFPTLRPKSNLVLGLLAFGLTLCTCVLSWLLPMFSLPRPTGGFAIGTRILEFVDDSRPEPEDSIPGKHRQITVQAWYPVANPYRGRSPLASYQRANELTRISSYRSVLKTNSYQDAPVEGGDPLPIILYNPGWMGERTEGTIQAEELASHGYFVVAIDHPYYGGLVHLLDGRVVDARNAPSLGSFEHMTVEEQAALGAKYVRIEAADDIFVLNQLENLNNNQQSSWYHRLNLSSVGAMGFSIGGAVATQTAIEDKRVKAALDLDGWSFGDVQQVGLAKPWMILFEDKHRTLPTPIQLTTGSPAERANWVFSQNDYDGVTRSMAANGGYILFLANSHHADFTDRSLFSPIQSWTGKGTIGPARAHQIINAYTRAFFNQYLKGSPEALLQGNSSPFKEVEMHKFMGK